MSSGSFQFNPEQFKAQQRQMWDNVAKGWLAWWETFERGAQKVSDKLAELAEIKPGPFALADKEKLKKSFSQAGFRDIQLETIQITFSFDSPESFTSFHQQIAASLQVLLYNQPDEKKKQIWNSVTDAVWPYADSHGKISLDNEMILIAAKN